MNEMSLPSSKENTGSELQESVSWETSHIFLFPYLNKLRNFSQPGKAADPFAISSGKEKESSAPQKVIQPRAVKDPLIPQGICQDMLHMTCFFLPPRNLERFEEKKKAC